MIIEGKVLKVFSRKENGYATGVVEVSHNKYGLRTPDGVIIKAGQQIGISGEGIPDVGQDIKFDGEFRKSNPRYKPSMQIKSIISISGKMDPLAMLMNVQGVGKTTAKKIVDKLGEDCINKIISDPELLTEMGLSRFQDKIEAMFSEKITPVDYNKFIQLGFNPRQVSTMVRLSETNTINEFKENPYSFIVNNEIEFRTIDEIARKNFNFSDDSVERLSAAVTYILKSMSTTGSTYFHMEVINESFKKLTGFEDTSFLDKTLQEMIESKKLWARVNKKTGEKVIGLTEVLEKEKFVAQELFRMSQFKGNVDASKEIEKRERESGFKLADSQRQAVLEAVNHQVFVLRGGPGTGKTFTLSSIIASYKGVFGGMSIVCLAPTGRAAKRMTEETKREATTIHSYLKLRPGMKKSEVLIDADLLVIDESSMIDLDIAYALMSSLSPQTRLLFIGDVNQLPSIGAGNILSDMITSGVVPLVELGVVYRQAEDSNINKNANKILHGNQSLIIKDDFEYIRVNSPKEAQDAILAEMKKATDSYGLVETCILTPVRRNKDTSVNVINPIAQQLLNPASPHKAEISINGRVFRLGDKVMITRNSSIAANGDVGIIVDLDVKSREVTIDLGYSSPITLSAEDLETLDLAYAMTIHKSQGSEYDCVIITVMDEHASLLQKNLIYTAITRAKKKVVLIGQDSAIVKSINGVQKPRNTLLATLLKHMDKNSK